MSTPYKIYLVLTTFNADCKKKKSNLTIHSRLFLYTLYLTYYKYNTLDEQYQNGTTSQNSSHRKSSLLGGWFCKWGMGCMDSFRDEELIAVFSVMSCDFKKISCNIRVLHGYENYGS